MIEFITANWVDILAAFSTLLVLLTQLAALSTWKWDDEAVSILSKIFNVLTGNYGNAKNATKAKDE